MGERFKELESFYRGKRVLVTGHTGFKGSYLCLLLTMFGAEPYGYALKPPTDLSIFSIIFGETDKKELAPRICDEGRRLHSCIGDVRDYEALRTFYKEAAPDIVIHLAAQPIVRESYVIPRETYEINVMGTVNLLECIRTIPGCRSVLNVTTDKVYLNEEKKGYGYREEDRLDGFDPYSNSKSCSELVTHSYSASFLKAAGVSVSTARAGNVIGGGDFAKDRILPDFVRAIKAGKSLSVRNPGSTRPYQHVLEPLFSYLYIAMKQYEDMSYAGWYNVGPDDCDCVTTGELCDIFAAAYGEGASWNSEAEPGAPHEADFLKLDNTRLKETFGLHPVWHIAEAVKAAADWTRAWLESDEDAVRETVSQIKLFGEKF
ncbi:MAG TPA: CDP-glucose 4,6-dehydratase [Candidatus Avilachnospira avicola]|nr:CDP-glucose 4,6-dehydratase [Candidatus Avilachnospira avicola]